MFSAILLALREGIEVALVLGIVLGSLRQLDRSYLKPALWIGAASAAFISLVAAVVLNMLGAEFEGQGEQIFEGTADASRGGADKLDDILDAARNLADKDRYSKRRPESLWPARLVGDFFFRLALCCATGSNWAVSPGGPVCFRFHSDHPGRAGWAVDRRGPGVGRFYHRVEAQYQALFLYHQPFFTLFRGGAGWSFYPRIQRRAGLPAGVDMVWNISSILSEDSRWARFLPPSSATPAVPPSVW